MLWENHLGRPLYRLDWRDSSMRWGGYSSDEVDVDASMDVKVGADGWCHIA